MIKKIMRVVSNNKSEIIIFLIIPLVIIFSSLLPSDIKDIMKEDLSRFNMLALLTAYTALFIHDNFNHLFGNIVAYYTYISLSYLLCKKSHMKTWFILNYVSFFLFIPPITHIALFSLNILYLNSRLSLNAGLSGIVSAFLSLTVVSFLVFLKKYGIIEETKKLMFPLFITSALCVRYIYNSFLYPSLLIILLLACILLFKEELIAVVRFIKRLSIENPYLYFLSILSVFLYFLGILLLFPSEIVFKGYVVNVLAHYLGWIFGFVFSLLLLKLETHLVYL